MSKGTFIYDDIDLKNSFRSGYWLGSVISFICTTIVFALVGLYLKT